MPSHYGKNSSKPSKRGKYRPLTEAQKKKLKDQVERLVLIHEELFPGGNLQERVENFSFFYIEKGHDFKSFLIETFNPLSNEFTFIEI